MTKLLAAAGVALLLVAFAPTATAQAGASTPTTLYFHIFDTFSAFPINTQPPDIAFFDVGGTSFPTIVSQGYAFNTVRGFSTAGPVEYDFIEGGRPRFHFEAGIARAVQLDKNAGATAHLYLDVRDLIGTSNAPNAIPSFTFEVAVRSGNSLASEETLDGGELLMSGDLTAYIVDTTFCLPPGGLLDELQPIACQNVNAPLAGQSVGDTPLLVPDEAGVVAFEVPLTMERETIPKDGFNIRIRWWQNPTGDASADNQFAEGFVRLVLDAAHLPRLELAVKNPIYVEYVHPQVAAGILLIHTAVNSPWGTYDADVANMTVKITGPDQPERLQQVISQNAHVHNLHGQAAEVTWLWRYRDEGAALGDYTIEVKIPNLAGNAFATDSGRFTIEKDRAVGYDEDDNIVTNTHAPSDEPKGSPGAGILLAGALLAVAALARRKGGGV